MGIGIYPPTFIEEHLAIRALPATDKKHKVMLGGKTAYIGHTVGYLTADSVETLEHGIGRDMLTDVLYNFMELIKRLGGLTVKIDVTSEVEKLDIVKTRHNNGMPFGLPHQPKDFGMSGLTENNYLWRRERIAFLYPPLQLQNHRTGGIDNFYVVTFCQFVGLRRLSVGTQQHLCIVQFSQVVMIDGYQPHLLQSLTLHTVMNDISKTVKPGTLGELFLCFADSGSDTKTEAAACIYLWNDFLHPSTCS